MGYMFIRVQILGCRQGLKATVIVANHKENLFMFSIYDKNNNYNLLNIYFIILLILALSYCDPCRLDITSIL